MKTTDYLNEAFKRSGAKSKAKFAEMLGVNRSAITMYESGERVMDDYVAAQIADMLKVETMVIIAQANIEREKDETRRDYWKRKSELALRTAACIALAATLFIFSGDVETPFATAAYAGWVSGNTNYGGFDECRPSY
ncbi:helix-turn-helix domain-containing protein [Azoarcus communis]|uniref:helix-turn-helix domain-containing protein n=1 Tax=Parazoarcus communis TaxID=41977 RepID=UPI001459BB50|nr:helix-turn-helix transcriptional regulator [Parazoarcus communis]NMG46954.1 helix-turn-helix domain-containing protein [Parazoarcus communis]